MLLECLIKLTNKCVQVNQFNLKLSLLNKHVGLGESGAQPNAFWFGLN